jgi:hypothetical protein
MYLEETFNNLKMVKDQNILQVQWKTLGNEFVFEKMDFEKLPKGRSNQKGRQLSETCRWSMILKTP